MKKVLYVIPLFMSVCAYAGSTAQPVVNYAATVVSSAPVVSGIATTVTIPAAPVYAYSTGYYNYLAEVHIEDRNTGGVAGNLGTAVNCTLSGVNAPSMTWGFLAAVTTGQINIINENYSNPIVLSTTSVTITCPANTGTLWNIRANYIQAP